MLELIGIGFGAFFLGGGTGWHLFKLKHVDYKKRWESSVKALETATQASDPLAELEASKPKSSEIKAQWEIEPYTTAAGLLRLKLRRGHETIRIAPEFPHENGLNSSSPHFRYNMREYKKKVIEVRDTMNGF